MVWLLNSGLIRIVIDAMRFLDTNPLRRLAMMAPPLRRELLQRWQARGLPLLLLLGEVNSPWLQGRFRTLTAHSSECTTAPYSRFDTAGQGEP